MFQTAGQARIFLAAVVAGLAVGVLYGAFTLLRKLFKNGASATGVLDIIFWIGSAVVFTAAMVYSGGDGLRWYMLVGFAAGVLVYLAGINAILMGALGKCSAFVSNIIHRIREKTREEVDTRGDMS